MFWINLKAFSVVVIALCMTVTEVEGQVQLRKLHIDPKKISVSGISSGAAMATQFHFAHSSEVLGAGLFAGVPYMCGHAGLSGALGCMNTPALVNVNRLISETSRLESQGSIDSTANILGRKVYVYHGSEDSTVLPGSGRNIEQMYKHYGADIMTEFSIPAEHGQPSENYGAPCGSPSEEHGYINNCDYHGAFEMANYLYGGNLIRPNNNTEVNGDFQIFDQGEFFNFNPGLSSMDTEGYIYIPSGCRDPEGESCALHIVYHGCQQYKKKIGDVFATKTGYLEVAELNNIVLLFPQTISTPVNPNGCWDWWGYLNSYFPTKSGNHVLATQRMINRLLNGDE